MLWALRDSLRVLSRTNEAWRHGPALIPESLGRLQGERLETVIAKGRPATQMQGFDQILSKQEIDALVAYLATSVPGNHHLERFRYRGDAFNGCGLQTRKWSSLLRRSDEHHAVVEPAIITSRCWMATVCCSRPLRHALRRSRRAEVQP